MQKSRSEQTQSELDILRKAVETSGEVIFLTDREGIITYVNPEFSRLYGFSAEEVIGKTTPRILKSGYMTDKDYEQFWEALLNKQVVKGEFINKHKNGTSVTVEGSANPILDEDDDIIGFLAIQRDVAEQKRAKQELEAAHVFQQSIINGVTEPIMVIGTEFQVIAANHAAREFSSGDKNGTLPVHCYQISHLRESPCDGIEHPCPLQQVQETGQAVIVVHEHFQANGERRYVEVVASPLWKMDGGFQGIIESLRDITDRKKAEEAILQYTERLKALASQVAEVEDSERQRLARELHDRVGQNLTALGINLNIIRMQIPEETPDSVHYHLADSLSLVEQTAERIRDVMANLRPPVLDDYGLVAALRWYGETISRRIDIPITVEGEEPDPRMPTRVENALFRITQEALTNVAKHSQASHVIISVDMVGDILRLSVSDDGMGFDPQHLTETGDGQGWGLLSITERAEAVGGQVRIVSSPNQGSVVTVEVPR